MNEDDKKEVDEMAKLPAMPFYIGDWRKDPGVRTLDRFHKSIWFDMICLMWESEERGKLMLNGKPMPIDALSEALKLDNPVVEDAVNLLIERGVAKVEENTGIIYCARQVRDEARRIKNIENGSKGGNPALKRKSEGHEMDNQGDNQGDNGGGYPPPENENAYKSTSFFKTRKTNGYKNTSLKTRKTKELKKQYEEYVYLTDSEYQKLVEKFGKVSADDKIRKLDEYIGGYRNAKKKYTDHYRVILTWARKDDLKQPRKGGLVL
jgi:hypothetical protein